MTPMEPTIRAMHAALDNAGRADVLLRCPRGVLWKFHHVFMDACGKAQFEPGIEYLIVEQSARHAVLQADGTLPPVMQAGCDMARLNLVRIVKAAAKAQQAEAAIGEGTDAP
jgi:hypothetical protein